MRIFLRINDEFSMSIRFVFGFDSFIDLLGTDPLLSHSTDLLHEFTMLQMSRQLSNFMGTRHFSSKVQKKSIK